MRATEMRWVGFKVGQGPSLSAALVLFAASLQGCADDAAPLEPQLEPDAASVAACTVVGDEGSGGVCEVRRVIDGDTLLVDLFGLEVKVRLAEIDAPESQQEYGHEATELLKTLVTGEEVEVVKVGSDRYGRLLAHLHGEGGCVNQQLVESGAAWHYDSYSDSTELAALQGAAESARVGLWGREVIVAPWEFRRGGPDSPGRAKPSRQLAEVVYWTASGSKYHRQGCRYVSRSKSVSRGDSPPDQLGPCSVCIGRDS